MLNWRTQTMGTHAVLSVEERLDTTASARERRMRPRAGDVLASERTARADVYAISIVPAGAHLTERRYSTAIERVRSLAQGLKVDGWFTCDHTHYARVANFRDAHSGASSRL
jgi:hypothetical protein